MESALTRATGEGIRDAEYLQQPPSPDGDATETTIFAPASTISVQNGALSRRPQALQLKIPHQGSISRAHTAWSKAVNSRIGRADNARFLEHFRYIIVASQLLNEYLDHGTLQSSSIPAHGLDGSALDAKRRGIATSTTGAIATAAVAFALVWLIHWARTSRPSGISKSRVALVLTTFIVVAMIAYAYVRRQWLKYLRHQAVDAASTLTTNWQAFEVSSSSALSFIQEVELVSKGYRLSTPLPPVSRLEEQGATRRCARLRKVLHDAYASTVPAFVEACSTLHGLLDEDDLEKYFEIYDISSQDARESSSGETLAVLEDDPESLKSLRVLSYRAGILRRVTLCSLMALEADGGKPDFYRWRAAVDIMARLSAVTATSSEKLKQMLTDMEHFQLPKTPCKTSPTPARERLRAQVRKISTLSSGIRGLQAKMQILREESNKSIEQSDDLTDLGPSLMAQYESIGTDLRDLMQAWETGKASLASKITKHERRISMASSGLRSPVSSLGGLTAVEEGSPADALRALNGDPSVSNRSSLATTPSDEEVFEAIALPRQRSTLTREERIAKMHEERVRQSTLREKRDANTSMLKELESVINLRPKKAGSTRITSI